MVVGLALSMPSIGAIVARAFQGRLSQAICRPFKEASMRTKILTPAALALAVSLSCAAPYAHAQAAKASAPAAPSSASSSVQPRPVTGGIYRFKLGAVWVTALSDGTLPLPAGQLLHGIDKTALTQALSAADRGDPLETSINAFLIELEGRRILVDTGAGALFGPAGGRLLDRLAAVGVRPDQIDDILITHIHTDHSGGLARDGRAIFPNATVHPGRSDGDLFLDRTITVADVPARHYDEAAAMLGPYRRAGRLDLFSGEKTFAPGLVARPTPGHTPGHMAYELTSQGQTLVFIGDMIHAGPVQFARPEVTITYDVDQAAARDQRQAQLARYAAQGVLIAGPHLEFPGVGRLRVEGRGYHYYPVAFTDRD